MSSTRPSRTRQRAGVPGVDHGTGAGGQVDPEELAGDELVSTAVLEDRRVGPRGLLGQRRATAPAVAEAADQQSRQQRRVLRVAHGVGERDVQRVPVEAVVEGVATDVARRLHRAGDGELPGLARQRGRQQPALDLGGQRERRAALAPLEQVGEAPVDDHHVPERMRGRGDVVDGVRVRDRGQQHLQHPDDIAPVRHRSQHPGELACRQHLQPLRAHHLLVGRTGQRHRLGGVPALGTTALPGRHRGSTGPPRCRWKSAMRKPTSSRGQPLTKLDCEHVHRSHRRRDLHRSEQRTQLQAPHRAVQHAQILLANRLPQPGAPSAPTTARMLYPPDRPRGYD